MARTTSLADIFRRDDAGRQESLERKRAAARISIPWLYPAEEGDTLDPDQMPVPENFQSLMARGCSNMASNLTLTTWPVSVPAFEFRPNVGILESDEIPPEVKQEMIRLLHIRDIVIASALETGIRGPKDRPASRVKFRTTKYLSNLSLVVLGDSLTRMHDDFRWSQYRLENYVTDRDDCGDVNYHIIRERKDLEFLPDKILRDTFGLRRKDVMEMGDQERIRTMFTRVRWQPNTKKWVIEQEMELSETDRTIINTVEEQVSSWISSQWSLFPGDNYGRGFVELNIGDATAFDSLSLYMREFAAMCSKMTPCVDGGSNVKPRDLEQPSGVPLMGTRVEGGKVMDVAFLTVDKTADFSVVAQVYQALRRDLGASMLIESEMQPKQDRVTREQILSIRNELEKATVGAMAANNDTDVEATIARADHVLVKKKIVGPLPKDAVEMRMLTGVAALSQSVRRTKLENFIRTAPLLGEAAIQYIDMPTALRTLARYDNIDEPGLVKTEKDIQRQTRDAVRTELARAAGEQAIATAGNLVEASAEAAMQPPAV